MSEVVCILRVPLIYAIVTSIMVGLCVCVFESRMGLSTFQGQIVILTSASVVVVIRLGITLFRQYAACPLRTSKLVADIYKEINRLSQSPCTRFRPPDGDARVAYIYFRKKGTVTLVYCVSVGGHLKQEPSRWFRIEPSGAVGRRSDDLYWLRRPLIPQLRDLLSVLQKCQPCSKIEQGARREDR